jgi:hypothetical protein
MCRVMHGLWAINYHFFVDGHCSGIIIASIVAFTHHIPNTYLLIMN